jgi:hypothetical protein
MAKTTKIHKVTYLNARAEVKEIPLGGGVRETRIRWIDAAIGQPVEWPAGTVTSRTTKGNALKGTLVVLNPTHVVEEF